MRAFTRALLVATAVLLPLALASCTGNGTVTPPAQTTQKSPSVAVDWNEALLAAIRADKPRPTVVSRQLFLASATMYDAWAMYDATAKPVAIDAALRHPVAEDTDANKRAAVAY